MASYDHHMEERVWKRVRSEQAAAESRPDPSELLGLIQSEQLAAAQYLALARRMGPKNGALLQNLAQQEQSHARCLRGMYIQITGNHPAPPSPKPGNEPFETALCKCYAATLKAICAYHARSADPQYGPAFDAMAQQEQAQSRTILELLGNT